MGKPDKSDDRLGELRPRLGRTDRARERIASSPLRVARLVRRGHGRLGGKGAARLPPTAGFGPRHNARRVVVKAHVQRLGSHGAQAATRHLRYIERGGVEKDGSPAVLYGPEGPAARETFEQPRLGERHQFRFIVSPEDARDLNLTDYVRELMNRVERDLGRHRPRRLPRGPAIAHGSRLHRPGPSVDRPRAGDRALGAAARGRDSTDA